jgi:hypothetical protein
MGAIYCMKMRTNNSDTGRRIRYVECNCKSMQDMKKRAKRQSYTNPENETDYYAA